ncbi:hypothetical protein ID866_7546 [Astraeus odoratus]|nr:hypothetical protein ID866_7546 [Astraeus odoratus]
MVLFKTKDEVAEQKAQSTSNSNVEEMITVPPKKKTERDGEEAEPCHNFMEQGKEEGQIVMNNPVVVPPLQAFAQRAARYSINLNGRVHLTEEQKPLQGSTAIVYQGILQQEGKVIAIAIKTPRCALPGDKEALAGILREVHLWSKLDHVNVVRMRGISTEFNFTISIISDWMGRGDVRGYVQNNAIDPRPLLMDIVTGLDYLHDHDSGPIVHSDLKGLNVLVSDDGRALLTDFGYSALSKSSFSMTMALVPRGGSLPWMAPEMLEDDEVSAAGDVWAFGMTALADGNVGTIYSIRPLSRVSDEACSHVQDHEWQSTGSSRPGADEFPHD